MSPTDTPPRILIAMTSHAKLGDTGKPTGAWYSEIANPYYVWRDAGSSVTLASIRGGAAVIDPLSREESWQTEATRRMDRDESAMEALRNTRSIASVDGRDYDVLYAPGGLGVMWDFPESQSLTALVESFARSGKQVVTVCHGAAALLRARNDDGTPIVAAKVITAFTDAEETALGTDSIVPFLLEKRLRELGATFQGGPDWSDTVRTQGWLTTGQNPASAERAARTALIAWRHRHEPAQAASIPAPRPTS